LQTGFMTKVISTASLEEKLEYLLALFGAAINRSAGHRSHRSRIECTLGACGKFAAAPTVSPDHISVWRK